jgi:chromosome segregation ATPase
MPDMRDHAGAPLAGGSLLVQHGLLDDERLAVAAPAQLRSARPEAAAAIGDARRLAAELESAQAQVATLTSRIAVLQDVVDPLRAEVQAGAARQQALERELALLREDRDSAQSDNRRLLCTIKDAEERLHALRLRVEGAFADVCRPQNRSGELEQSAARLAAVLNSRNDHVLEANERHLNVVRFAREANDA